MKKVKFRNKIKSTQAKNINTSFGEMTMNIRGENELVLTGLMKDSKRALNLPALEEDAVTEKFEEYYVERGGGKLYLLLGVKDNYFTVIKNKTREMDSLFKFVKQCLSNFGTIVYMDFSVEAEDDDRLEIWCKTEKIARKLYLIPYDNKVWEI